MFAEVVVDVSNNSVDKIFDYKCPKNFDFILGQRILVPFGNRFVIGYILSFKDDSTLEGSLIKQIVKPLDNFALIKPELLAILPQIRDTFNLRLIDIIHLIVPAQVRSGKIKKQITKIVYLSDFGKQNYKNINPSYKNQLGICEYLIKNSSENIVELNKQFGNSTVKNLTEKGFLRVTEEDYRRVPMQEIAPSAQEEFDLTLKQQQAYVNILQSENSFNLLFGVTGSGKTEVYMHIIKNALKNNKTAIMLVPEISLTPKTVKQFRSRFGSVVAVLHSGLSDGEKYDEWFRLHSGEAKIAIGARSAIFAPLENLGAIIIDEEHDSSYQSETNPRYETIEIAKLRSIYSKCTLLLGSATPSMQTFYGAINKEYNLITLDERINCLPMPKMEIVDMVNEFKKGNKSVFSDKLLNEIATAVQNNEQILLFINRRGYSSFQMCRECSYVAMCTDCDISLVYHKEDNFLKCHYCGKKFKPLTKCPNCNNANLKLGNTGTEKIVFDIEKLFPNVKVFRMDNDTTTTKNAHAKILEEFEKTKPAILVGTQMIAKGHDFPLITLVGILDADLSLYFNDFRATEKTFQLITQVAGRAGRADKKGKVILQTFFPKHYVYNFSINYDYLRFYNKEINLRETANFPPFSKIVRVLITSINNEDAKDITHELFLKLKQLRTENQKEFFFLQAMRAPHTKIKKKFRYQILIRMKNNAEIISQIFTICNITSAKVSVFVEINPQSLS